MADLVSIGVSGLSAYQNALSVTGNNIANVNTPGYVDEQAVLAPAGLSGNDVISIGGGVLTQSISRLSNEFLESNLREATAAVGAQNSLVQGLSQLQNEIGSPTSGLSAQLQSFFNSVSALQANPSDAGTRANFIGAAQSTVEQFNSVGSTLQSLSDDTVTQINNSTDTVNGILKQIYSVNQEINLHASDKTPPATLLDQRDQLLTQLSQNMGITSTYSNSGAVTVYAGNSATGPALVNSTSANLVNAVVDPNDASHVSFVINQKSNPQTISPITSGVIGGYVNFLSQGIVPTVNQINRLANTFGNAINVIQTNGMDATGKVGQPMFYLGPAYQASGPAIAGNENLAVTMADPTAVTGNAYTGVFDQSTQQWTITNNSSGASKKGSGNISFEGLNFDFTGSAVNGDTFQINPTSTAAQSIAMAIQDPSQIATASQIQAQANLQANQGNATISASATPLPSVPLGIKPIDQVLSNGVSSLAAATTFPSSMINKTVAYIPAGTSNINLNAASGNFAIFTRDGVQLSGPSLTSLNIDPATIINTANGFNLGPKDNAAARYNTDYLNATSGQSSYLGQNISYGQTVAPVSKIDINGNPIAGSYTPAVLTLGPFNSGQVTLNAGSIVIDGKSFPATQQTFAGADSATIAGAIASQINAPASGLDVHANVVNGQLKLYKPPVVSTAINTSFQIQIGANNYNADSLIDLQSAINIDTPTTGIVASGGPNGPLNLSSLAKITINGTTYSGVTKAALVAAINNSTATSNISASLNSADGTISLSSNSISTNINISNANFSSISAKSVAGKSTLNIGSQFNPPTFSIGANTINMAQATSTANVTSTPYYVTLNGTVFSAPTLTQLATDINSYGATPNVANSSVYSAAINSAGTLITFGPNTSPTDPIKFLVGDNNLGIPSGTAPDLSPITINVADTSNAGSIVDNSNELTQLGLNPGFQMQKPLGEDLLVVALPSTNGRLLSLQASFNSATGSNSNPNPASDGGFDASTTPIKRNWKITFTDATHYSISDIDSGLSTPTTVVSGATFDPTNPTISYGDWTATLSGTPKPGDSFSLSPTDSTNASNDNSNVQQFSLVASNQNYFGNNMTLSQAYTATVNDIGAKLSQAQTAQTTQKAVLTQAQSARDSVSGVNLDNELANMLKYQQAYQASSKIVSTAMQLFDYLIQAL